LLVTSLCARERLCTGTIVNLSSRVLATACLLLYLSLKLS